MAAIQGDLTLAELVKKFDVHANQITDWKKQLLGGAPDVFGKGAKKQETAGVHLSSPAAALRSVWPSQLTRIFMVTLRKWLLTKL